MNRLVLFCIVALATIVDLRAAVAEPILQPSGVFLPSFGTFFGYTTARVRDQSGLSAGYTNLVTNFDTYTPSATHNSTLGSATIWISNNGSTTGFFDFLLSGPFTLGSFALWNYGIATQTDPAPTGANIQDFKLFADGVTQMGGTFTATTGGPTSAVPSQVFTFPATSVTSFVRMEVVSNYGANNTAFGEAAFEVVPEPATLTLLGIGLAALALRRFRQ